VDFMGEVCPCMEIFQRSDGFFIDSAGVQLVWSVSGSDIG
jgi:hypothetical protein